MSNYYSLLLLSLLYSLKMSIISSSAARDKSTIILALTRPSLKNKNNLLENLKYQAAASLERAQHLKCPKKDDVIKTKFYPQKDFYSVQLRFGTPPQLLHFNIDTGSDLSWFPCTQKYACTHCDNPGPETPIIFIPKDSSSYEPLSCRSRQCKWLVPNNYCIKSKCGYIIRYGLGNTTGRLVSETLTFPAPTGGGEGLSVNNFTIGCSVSSDNEAEGGILGLGRGPLSLPSQMALASFTYCMVTHEHDGNPNATSDLVLTTTNTTTDKVHYTPFATNPNVSSYPAFLLFYYVRLQSISVGGILVKVPNKYLVPDPMGHGGTIVDSGTTLTYMEKPVFDLVNQAFQNQVGKRYKRNKTAETVIDLGLCYDVGRKNKTSVIKLPKLTLTFQGGTKMDLPLENYFLYADKDKSILCMTIVNGGGGDDGKVSLGPAIILGNYLQQNYYMKFDLANNRLGIRPQYCMQVNK